MTRVRLGAVGYLNARPLVYGLERSHARRFDLRFDVPSRCAELLHERRIDVGMIPSIEYLRSPASDQYRIVPDVAIASRGVVASVALYTTREMRDVRSVAMDTSSRTSVALVRILCARSFHITPVLDEFGPDLELMLDRCDAALLIGDHALFAVGGTKLTVDSRQLTVRQQSGPGQQPMFGNLEEPAGVEKIDLGEVWTELTGLPFVWAFWAGRSDGLTPEDVGVLQRARDAGVQAAGEIARDYFEESPARQAAGARYLRDNIKYSLGPDERAGLELFYRYAAEAGLVDRTGPVLFYEDRVR